MRNNSTIFKNPEEKEVFNLAYLGTVQYEDDEIRITQSGHFFQVGDALYFNPKTGLFEKALANNTISIEVCGVVSQVINVNTFVIVTQGRVETSRYQYPEGSVLYLSEVVPGQLMSVSPVYAHKPVATQTFSGVINVDIHMGFVKEEDGPLDIDDELEPYTTEELDEIIQNIKSM